MALSLVSLLRNDSGQVQVRRSDLQAHLLPRLAAGAGIRRLAALRVQLPAARTPQPQIGLLRPFEQQHFIALIKTIEQGGDFVRQVHGERARNGQSQAVTSSQYNTDSSPSG